MKQNKWGGRLSRKECKAVIAQRRADILVELSEITITAIDAGKSSRVALMEADKWLRQKVKENPQEAQLYRDVARDYSNALKDCQKEKEEPEFVSERLTEEQLQSWRTVLSRSEDPRLVAAMSDEEIQSLRDVMQVDVDNTGEEASESING